jgi:hypothetical protein
MTIVRRLRDLSFAGVVVVVVLGVVWYTLAVLLGSDSGGHMYYWGRSLLIVLAGLGVLNICANLGLLTESRSELAAVDPQKRRRALRIALIVGAGALLVSLATWAGRTVVERGQVRDVVDELSALDGTVLVRGAMDAISSDHSIEELLEYRDAMAAHTMAGDALRLINPRIVRGVPVYYTVDAWSLSGLQRSDPSVASCGQRKYEPVGEERALFRSMIRGERTWFATREGGTQRVMRIFRDGDRHIAVEITGVLKDIRYK